MTNICFIPEAKETLVSELLDCKTVVLANVRPSEDRVPRPISQSAPSVAAPLSTKSVVPHVLVVSLTRSASTSAMFNSM